MLGAALMYLPEIYSRAQRADYLRSQLYSANDLEKKYKARIQELETDRDSLNKRLSAIESKMQYERIAMDNIAAEKTQGFPWVAKAYEDFWRLQDGKIVDELRYKKHPALTTAQKMSQAIKERRDSEKAAYISRGIIGYCMFLAPWLEEFIGMKSEELDVVLSNIHNSWEKTDDELDDNLKKVIGPNDYNNLSQQERLQRKLDYYWTRKDKPDWQVGRDYERYIGYLYEKDGWKVQYHGTKGFEDLGRDLICEKNGVVDVVQCKRWAQGKEIHEKHIYYLFGTAIEFYLTEKIGNSDLTNGFDLSHFNKIIRPKLISTVNASEKAVQIARILGVTVTKQESKQFPSIKCNISQVDGSKIYHLPFDQQYDTTRIEEEKLECHVSTIKEAEKLGFRHAFRWHGDLKGG